MTFREIVDSVLADRFKEAQRADAQRWVNHRYWWLWSLEPWTFKQAIGNVTVTAGSQTVTGVATDFLTARALHQADGTQLELLPDHRVFFERYMDTTATGEPEAFTVLASTVYVGPTPTVSATYRLVYDREFTSMTADADVPALPVGAHFALVHGGCAEGLKLQNDPTWQSFEEDFQASLSVLRQNYLATMVGAQTQFGAYRPEQWA